MRENIKELEDLIQKGYELELMSFELDIPLTKLQVIKDNIDKREKNVDTISAKKDTQKLTNTRMATTFKKVSPVEKERINRAHNTIQTDSTEKLRGFQKIRAKYNELYYEPKLPERTEVAENEDINKILTALEEKAKVLEGYTKKERRPGVKVIYDTIAKISNQKFSNLQLKRLVDILYNTSLMNNRTSKGDTIDICMRSQRRTILPRFIKSVIAEIPYVQTEDELRNLSGMLTQQMRDENTVLFSELDLKLAEKRKEFANKNFIRNNSLTLELQEIVKKLAEGSLDFQEARKLIKDEAGKRFELTKENRFSLTAEQQEKQIYLNIGDYISNNGINLNIKSPKDFITRYIEFAGCDLSKAILVTSGNLASATRYDEAMNLCREFLDSMGQDNPMRPILKSRISEIKNTMYGRRILDVIHAQDSQRDREMYRELVDLIRNEKINPSYIPLGKSKDGSKEITLRSVFSEKIK